MQLTRKERLKLRKERQLLKAAQKLSPQILPPASLKKALVENKKKVAVEVWRKEGKLPKVLSEWKTLERVLNGVSLSRYGDGEIKHMDGRRNVSQVFDEKLRIALRRVFFSSSDKHLVGIPNVFDNRQFLDVHENYILSMQYRFGKITDLGKVHGSSYITRGDLCPYLSWSSYWGVISELWRGRDVVLVRGHEKRANPHGMMSQARNIERVETPQAHAWCEYERIVQECLRHSSASIYLLCVGPTATVLAKDLADRDRWAVDIGHLGMFYKRLGIESDEHKQVWNHRPTDPGYIKGVTDQC